MEVILTKPVRNLGKIGDIVVVKNGFARNYLIPQQLAIRSHEKNKKLIEQQKSQLEIQNTEKKLGAEAQAVALKDKLIVFIMQASEDGKLFGSIGKKDIAKSLSESSNISVTYSNVLLNNNIKSTGVFSVEVELHPEVTASVLVNVAKSETEAQDALSSFNNTATEA